MLAFEQCVVYPVSLISQSDRVKITKNARLRFEQSEKVKRKLNKSASKSAPSDTVELEPVSPAEPAEASSSSISTSAPEDESTKKQIAYAQAANKKKNISETNFSVPFNFRKVGGY